MNRKFKSIGFVLTLIFAILPVSPIWAVESLFVFQNSEQQVVFDQLSKTLRCVTCPNQSLADSHAPVAESMREEIYNMVLEGQSSDQIRAYFIARYSDYVVYQPPLNNKTWVLWFGPFILLCVGGGLLAFQLFKSRKQNGVV